MSLQNRRTARTFISILSDGLFHQTVAENTEGAKLRSYETSDGKTGSKWELTFDTISGKIEKIFFADGEFGTSIHVVIDGVEMTVGTASTFGEDFMKKLPNIDLDKEVTISPYSFTDEKGKARKGLSITQGEKDEKIQNYFYDPVSKEACNGLETIALPKKDKKGAISKDAWKLYFGQVRMYLIENTEKYCTEEKQEVKTDTNGYDDEEIEFDPPAKK